MTDQPSSSIALQPTIFVIFGITGDLASRKLLPSLLSLYAKKLLPKRFAVIGITRRSFSREEFREFVRSRMNVKQGQFREEDIKHFLDHLSYEQGNFDDPGMYTHLARSVRSIDDRWGQCSNKLFHLSVPPILYHGILTNLAASKLNIPCDDDVGWTRVLIEKPFGGDIVAARSLDKLLGKLFAEEQIFRIDHYLAKEALQNILVFRFSNAIFEPLWRRQFVDKIHIRLFEKVAMEERGDFYDKIGALKDVGQNHILAMLALMTMDAPASFSGKDIRSSRAKILAKLDPMSRRTSTKQVVRGQYEGYLSEPGVKADSTTETYFRIEARLNSPRWKGVPFYLESGKAMAETKTEISVYFKNSSGGRGNKKVNDPERQNILTFRIQPDEGIKIRFFVKMPGLSFANEPKTLKFKYADVTSFSLASGDYERLIHDVFIGDQTLFASTDEIMASWRFVTSILENLDKLSLKKYQKGSKEVE